MHTVGAGGNGDISARVDEQASPARMRSGSQNVEEVAGELGELLGAEVLLAELKIINVFGRAVVGLVEQRFAACGLVGGEPEAIGDGIPEHCVLTETPEFALIVAGQSHYILCSPPLAQVAGAV